MINSGAGIAPGEADVRFTDALTTPRQRCTLMRTYREIHHDNAHSNHSTP